MAVIYGTAGDDTLVGAPIFGDWILGYGGNDSIIGGSGGDTLDGGDGNDIIYGNGGNDNIYGGIGGDMLFGGDGYDIIYGNDGNDTINPGINSGLVYGGEGDDFVELGGSAAGALGPAGGRVDIYGDAGNDVISFGAANINYPNIRNPGGDNNTARLGFGGTGNDVYIMGAGVYTSNPSPGYATIETGTARELVGEGQDTIFTSVDLTLEANTEIEVLSAFSSAYSTGLKLTGNALINTIIGGAGGDTIDSGANTSGGDTLYGLGGNDSYLVRSAADIVIEASGAGIDTVTVFGSYTLAFGSEIEALTLAAGLTEGAALTGNNLSNQISGGNNSDTLNGGASADTLIGGAGNDFYYVDRASDVVIEGNGGGHDIIFTAGSYSLGAGVFVEVLAATFPSGGAALTLVGNENNNQIISGAGGDTIFGFDGNDTIYGLAGNDNLNGGEDNDYLFGGDGADTLQGSTGADWLIGGAGVDVFKFSDATDSLSTSMDVITDFLSGTDKLDFSSFAGTSGPFTIGTLTSGGGPRIEIGTSAADGYYHILADIDGNGAADFELLVAAVNGASIPVAGDFIL